MKKLVSLLAIALFTVGFAQETKPAQKDKKECCSKDKKACCATKKAA